MAGLVDDILACLEELAPDAVSGGGSGGGSGGSDGGWPLAWLLLDLQQLLPPNSSMAQKQRSDIGQLARTMEAADRDEQKACRHASALLAAIAQDSFSTQQLVELFQKNDAMLQLCRQALQKAALADQRSSAADAVCKGAWKALQTAAAKLDTAERCVRYGTGSSVAVSEEQLLWNLDEAAEGALRALQVATQLSHSTGGAKWALEQHDEGIAAALRGAAEAARRGSLPAAAKDRLSQLLAWWAEQVPLLVCKPWRCSYAHSAAIGITGEWACRVFDASRMHMQRVSCVIDTLIGSITCAGRCQHHSLQPLPLLLPPAGQFLDTALPRLLRQDGAGMHRQLRPNGGADRLANVLAATIKCSGSAQSAADRAAAQRLLVRSAPAAVEVLCSFLALQPQQEAAAPCSHTARREVAAAEVLVHLADVVLYSLKVACSDHPAAPRLQPEALLQLEQTLLDVGRGWAACCAWLPDRQQADLVHVCCQALNQLAHMFAPLHLPPPLRERPPPAVVPQPTALLSSVAEAAGVSAEGGRRTAPSSSPASGTQAGSMGASRLQGQEHALPSQECTAGRSVLSYADVARGTAPAFSRQPTSRGAPCAEEQKPTALVKIWQYVKRIL